MGYQTQVGFQTWDDGVPDRWWGTRQGWVKKGNLSFSEFSNVHFNLTSRGFNLTSCKIISFTSHGNLTSHQSGILHSLITAHIRRMGKVMFSVCPHLGGGGQGQRSIQPGGCQVKGQSSRGESGQRSIQPGGQVKGQSSRGGVRSSWLGGEVRSSQGGGSGPASGGVSASCALLRAVCHLRSRRRTFLFLSYFCRSRTVIRVISHFMLLVRPDMYSSPNSHFCFHILPFLFQKNELAN